MAYTYERTTVLVDSSDTILTGCDVTIVQSGLRISSHVERTFVGDEPYALRIVNGNSNVAEGTNIDSFATATMSTMGGSTQIGAIDEIPTSYFKYETGTNVLEQELTKQSAMIDTYTQQLKDKVSVDDLDTQQNRNVYNAIVRMLTEAYGFHAIPSTPPEDPAIYTKHENKDSEFPFNGSLDCGGMKHGGYPCRTPYGTYWFHTGLSYQLRYEHDLKFLPYAGTLKNLSWTTNDLPITKVFHYDVPRLHNAIDKFGEIYKAQARIYLRSKFANKSDAAEEFLNFAFIQNCPEWDTINGHISLPQVQAWVNTQHASPANLTSHGRARRWQYFFGVAGFIPTYVPTGGLTQGLGIIGPTTPDFTYILETFIVKEDGEKICWNGKLVPIPDSVFSQLDETDPDVYSIYVAELQLTAAQKEMKMTIKDRYPNDPTNFDDMEIRIGQGFQRLLEAQQQAQRVHDIGHRNNDDEGGGWGMPDWKFIDWVFIPDEVNGFGRFTSIVLFKGTPLECELTDG